ncbi:MAG: glycosyltransferase family 39 protein [Verrucomicrobia bacterium]|nr:glycosyltransferase family 39 protein [Verrucomicrobiota bacterium]
MTSNAANGLTSRATDFTQSKPLSGALKELRSDPLSGAAIVAYLAVLKLLLHFYFNAFSYYGYLRDELYFIQAGKRLDWGYVDIGPLTIWMGRLSRELMGDSIFALRFFPAIAGAVMIVLVGLMARELGGGRFAQVLAALAALIAPVWLGAQNNLCLPATEPVWWGLCAYFLIRIIKTGNTRLWVRFGVIAGIGLLNKPSMLFLCAAVTIGLLLTPERKYLFNRWALLGGLAALLVFGQVFYLHPFNFPIWLAGLVWFFLAKDARPFRVLGWAYLFILGFLLVTKSKIYYLAPVYPFLLAGGAVAIERFINKRRLAWLKAALLALLVAGGLSIAPVVLPVLPIDKTDAYITASTAGLLKNAWEVTSTFHDEHGWENQAKVVAEVFRRLSPEEQADCIIVAGNFGEAGAIDFYGPALGLPPATSTHQNYYFWGPPAKSGNLVIAFGVGRDALQQYFGDVQQVATIRSPQAVRGEQNIPVYICRKPLVNLKEAWPKFRARAFRNN